MKSAKRHPFVVIVRKQNRLRRTCRRALARIEGTATDRLSFWEKTLINRNPTIDRAIPCKITPIDAKVFANGPVDEPYLTLNKYGKLTNNDGK